MVLYIKVFLCNEVECYEDKINEIKLRRKFAMKNMTDLFIQVYIIKYVQCSQWKHEMDYKFEIQKIMDSV